MQLLRLATCSYFDLWLATCSYFERWLAICSYFERWLASKDNTGTLVAPLKSSINLVCIKKERGVHGFLLKLYFFQVLLLIVISKDLLIGLFKKIHVWVYDVPQIVCLVLVAFCLCLLYTSSVGSYMMLCPVLVFASSTLKRNPFCIVTVNYYSPFQYLPKLIKLCNKIATYTLFQLSSVLWLFIFVNFILAQLWRKALVCKKTNYTNKIFWIYIIDKTIVTQ